MTTPRRPKTKADRGRKADEMTDEEAADFYYAHRDGPGDAVTAVDLEAPRRLSRVVSVRFDPEEAVVIEQRAKIAGLTMSAYVRQAALGRLGLPLAQLSELLNTVADDVAHIRDKIGA